LHGSTLTIPLHYRSTNFANFAGDFKLKKN